MKRNISLWGWWRTILDKHSFALCCALLLSVVHVAFPLCTYRCYSIISLLMRCTQSAVSQSYFIIYYYYFKVILFSGHHLKQNLLMLIPRNVDMLVYIPVVTQIINEMLYCMWGFCGHGIFVSQLSRAALRLCRLSLFSLRSHLGIKTKLKLERNTSISVVFFSLHTKSVPWLEWLMLQH